MALILIEGFDHYDPNTTTYTIMQIEKKWRHTNNDSCDTMVTDTANGKGYALRLDSSAGRFFPHFGHYYRDEVVGYSASEGIVGFHWRTNSYNTSTGTPILALCDGRFNGSTQMSLKVDGTTGKLKLYLANSSQELGVSSQSIANDTWYYIELKYQVSNSIDANSTILRVDGHEWIKLPAGTDTRSLGSDDVTSMKWQGVTSANRDIDNVYVCDTSGSYNNGGFLNLGLGCFVETLQPNAAGNYSQFTPAASTNYSQVDDVAPDETTTYNESTTANHKDTFGFPDLDVNLGKIHGVQTVTYARRETYKMCRLRQMCRIESTDYTRNYKFSALDEYWDYFIYLWETNPIAGGLWVEADLNDAEFGYTFDTTIENGTVAY